MFRGATELAIDAKGRMAMPAKYRETLVDRYAGELVVTVNPSDRCLWVYPRAEWEGVEEKLMKLSSFDRQQRRLKQLLMGYASDVKMDSNNRVLLAPELRRFANLDKQVMLIGQGNKFELWDQPSWAAQCDEWREGMDQEELAEAIVSLSI